MDAEKVISEVLKDKIFYDNFGGGLTLYGGEPLMQFDFAYEILKLAKQNILAIEIEPYHSLGNNKHKRLGKTEQIQSFQLPTEKQVEKWIVQIQKQTEIIVKKAQ